MLIEIQDIFREEQSGLTTEDKISFRMVLHQTYNYKLLEEEIEWCQSFKIEWLEEGDLSTGFFHCLVSTYQRVNTIISSDGDSTSSEKDEISEVIVRFFHQLYGSQDIADLKLDNLEFGCAGDKWDK
eukprot:TRINITY_DN12643_c3_g1_i1.p1 TRINITY_DN12643_c3_g1~~TRINITY_DN12643_c3_g1_i1.p1  ORF type:complete len:127 (-),score=29.01 TRINITY_DN12643_c3_g1_i1:81-461(-)